MVKKPGLVNHASNMTTADVKRGRGGSIIGVDPGQCHTWEFLTLWLIRGCPLGPLEASVLGGKTYSLEDKVR